MQHDPTQMARGRGRYLGLAGYLLCLIVLYRSISLIYTYTLHSMNVLAWSWYDFADLLINYDQGFVRRGLLGECIRRAAAGGPALADLNIVLFTNFVLLACALVLLAAKRVSFRPWNLLFVLLMPGSILSMASSGSGWIRKEAFFYTALALSALAVSALQGVQHPATKRVFGHLITGIIFLFSIVLIFVHEAFLFLATPAFVFLLIAVERCVARTARPRSEPDGHRRTWQVYAGLLIILFVGIMTFHATPAGAEAMWEHLNPADQRQLPFPGNHGAMDHLGQSTAQLIALPLQRMLGGFAWFWFAPLFGLMFYCLALVALNLGRETADGECALYPWAACYLVLTAAIVPLALIAEDWGRWIAAVNLSFLMLWLSIRPENLAVIEWGFLPPWLISARSVETFRSQVGRFSKSFVEFTLRYKALVVTAMFLFATTCRLPEVLISEGEKDNWLLILALEYVAYLLNHAAMHLFHIRSLGH